MKVIDFCKNGNVVRLYLGADDCSDYWFDDGDDAPYEHNAGIVYDEYVEGFVEFAFPLEHVVQEPADDFIYDCNSPFCKEDFKKRVAPCIIVVKNCEDSWKVSYSKYAGSQSDDVLKIYYEDNIEELEKKILAFGGVKLCAKVTKF